MTAHDAPHHDAINNEIAALRAENERLTGFLHKAELRNAEYEATLEREMERAEKAEAELASVRARTQVPEGYTVVPNNATRGMIDEWRTRSAQGCSIENAYYWMVKAAPILAQDAQAEEAGTPEPAKDDWLADIGIGPPEPAREAEALRDAEIERKAQEIYEGWSDQPGYQPWHPHGNSYKQYEARRQARAALGGTP